MPTKVKKVSKKNNTVIVNVNSHNRKKSIKTGSNSSRFQGNDHNSHVGALHVLTQSMANLLKTNVLNGQKTGEGNPPQQTPAVPHNIVATPPTAPNASRTRRSRLLFEANEPQRPGLTENANQIPPYRRKRNSLSDSSMSEFVKKYPLDSTLKIPKNTDSDSSSSSRSLSHETHHHIGFPTQEVGSYMRELAHDQRMVQQRTPPNVGLNPNYIPHQHTPLPGLHSPNLAENRPIRRHSGHFDAPMILRSQNVLTRQ